jgi:hypothetical protein
VRGQGAVRKARGGLRPHLASERIAPAPVQNRPYMNGAESPAEQASTFGVR